MITSRSCKWYLLTELCFCTWHIFSDMLSPQNCEFNTGLKNPVSSQPQNCVQWKSKSWVNPINDFWHHLSFEELMRGPKWLSAIIATGHQQERSAEAFAAQLHESLRSWAGKMLGVRAPHVFFKFFISIRAKQMIIKQLWNTVWARVNPFSVLNFLPRLVTLVTLVTLWRRLLVILRGIIGLVLVLFLRTLGCWLRCCFLHSGDQQPWNHDGNNGETLRRWEHFLKHQNVKLLTFACWLDH